MLHFWDPIEPKLFGVETAALAKKPFGTKDETAKGGKGDSASPGGNGAEVTTLFVTPEPSAKLQDSFRLEAGYEAFMGIQVPSLYFAYNRNQQEQWRDDGGGAMVQAKTMRDFSGMVRSVPDFAHARYCGDWCDGALR
jgi:hypothetical protein